MTDYYVWAVFTGPNSNRKIHSLYSTESAARAWADRYNETHDRQTPASVSRVPVWSE